MLELCFRELEPFRNVDTRPSRGKNLSECHVRRVSKCIQGLHATVFRLGGGMPRLCMLKTSSVSKVHIW